MPSLPQLPPTNDVFIETTELTHEHGGRGWEFGTCLWSPTTNAAGHKVYELMRAPVANDLVIHILKDHFDGVARRTHFVGYSYVAAPVSTTGEEPPSPGTWGDRGSYYRIPLRDYAPLDTPVSVDWFLEVFEGEIRAEIEALKDGRPHFLPFTIYANALRLNQGMYLTRCTPSLFSHLTTALQLSTPVSPNDVPGDTVALREFSEGRRSSAERQFFARNPAFTRAAKDRYGYRCQVCGFDFAERYGDLGTRYIEAHHLNPLSERDAATWTGNLIASTDDIRVVCANCHRMIHRRRPALSIDEVRAVLRASAH
jgi:hypothetical protein